MATPPSEPNGVLDHLSDNDHVPAINGHIDEKQDLPSRSQSPESPQHQLPDPPSPGALEELQPFDWEAFESRYEAALVKASEEETAILKEAESLSKYFQVWATAASSHDDARSVKRLQTRQRFVNLAEEKLSQKQKHYVEVVRAFETNFHKNELAAFHDAHFSSAEVNKFQQGFFWPNPEVISNYGKTEEYWEEEDDLGYYDDGVKRTLTDEQIAIFRHSEIRELERTKEKASKQPHSENSAEELDTSRGQTDGKTANKPRDGKKCKRRRTKQAKREPKPDLRKRTWDVVEAGLDSLDYD
ncbi:uncharacterized protein BBA_01762 [Beauveria bassiana ARSEF 2860]|uniref:Uncharacterized protein n=1 Tax=Beauveria bassiana (strain ARSEF 2860) TaxID=655819 RepID=J4UUU3_BEAB2|nr:uncharacterized protein BBA_01762 [Beauveria bassiana ARSEF 2860]EJP69797.1 hypothetical protein BBA_01762 [Beauveria bassiana ARSEF 2860]